MDEQLLAHVSGRSAQENSISQSSYSGLYLGSASLLESTSSKLTKGSSGYLLQAARARLTGCEQLQGGTCGYQTSAYLVKNPLSIDTRLSFSFELLH